jgi:hypothetical protein
MPDALPLDEALSLKKRCIGIDRDRILVYLFPHKPFIINFHNLTPFREWNFIPYLAKNEQQFS